MIIWALVFGMSLTLAGSGKMDLGAQIEHVFRTEVECKIIKEELDVNSKAAADKGKVDPQINSFGAVCVPIELHIHNKRKTTGA